ncbi:vacuolar membrane-associated protein iml1, partial [Ascosphaera atra]
LIEDAVASWSSTAEKYGLRLVEVPMSEASAIVRTQVFRRPYPIKLKIKPPDYVNPVINSPSSFTSQKTNDKLFYHKAILKKFDFVLDFESSKSFSADVDVQYSWGRPTYNYHQYIHRSGCVLAQITDEGCFLLAANHLFTTRMSTREASRLERDHNRPRASTLDLISPRLSPITPAIGREGSEVSSPLIPLQVDPQNVFRATAEIRDEMTKFCSDERQLRQFYATEAAIIAQGSIGGRAESSRPYNRGEPYSEPPPSSTTDSSIPTLELPERLFPSNLSNSLRYGLSRPTSSGRTSSRKPSVDSAMYDARAMSDSTRGPQSPSK